MRPNREARLRSMAAANRQRVDMRPHLAESRSYDTAEETVHVQSQEEALGTRIVWGRHGRVVLNSGESLPVRYAAVEADWPLTSHTGTRYERDARYPVDAQPRDYGAEYELQSAVETRAANLDPWQLLTDSVLPVDGPPIVRSDGVVLSGNGRTQSMRLAISRGLYGPVKAEMVVRAVPFGLDVAGLSRMQTPILVRVLESEVANAADLARYGMEMNRDPGQGMSLSEQSIGFARMMTPALVDRLTAIVAEIPERCSVRELMRMRSREIAEALSFAGIVDARKRSAFFTVEGGLSELAKDLVETMLAGLTVADIDAVRGASRPTRDRLVRAGVEFMRMRSAGKEWDLSQHNTAAVALVTLSEDRADSLRSYQGDSPSLVTRLLHPERFDNVPQDMGFATPAAVHPFAETLALALELPPRRYAALMASYATRALGSWRSMFDCLTPDDTFSDTIAAGLELAALATPQ